MKAKRHTAHLLRPLIRWTTGTCATAAIITVCCFLFPALTGNFAAISMTCALAGIIGLSIALPPLDPADDWVPLGLPERYAREDEKTEKAPVQPAMQEEPTSPVRQVTLPPVPTGQLLTNRIAHRNGHSLNTRHPVVPANADTRISWKFLHGMGLGKATNVQKLTKS